MDLPDINVWLALAFESHAHHTAAGEWFENTPHNDCCFCRMTQTGFLRISTNQIVFGDEALALSDAWTVYDKFRDDPRIHFNHEPLGLEHLWRILTSGKMYSPKVWNDAYLAAFCIAGDYCLVTFDHGFSTYQDLPVHIIRP